MSDFIDIEVAFLRDGDTAFRCPTRKECIDIYDARFQGLDEAVKLTGGDLVKRRTYCWTADRDADPQYDKLVWYFSIFYGSISSSNIYKSNPALPVAQL